MPDQGYSIAWQKEMVDREKVTLLWENEMLFIPLLNNLLITVISRVLQDMTLYFSEFPGDVRECCVE